MPTTARLLPWMVSIRTPTTQLLLGRDHVGLSGVLTRNSRAFGRLLQSNLALSLLLPTRNSIWPALIGISFERCIKYHRVVGRVTFFFLFAHAVFMIGKDSSLASHCNCQVCHGMGISVLYLMSWSSFVVGVWQRFDQNRDHLSLLRSHVVEKVKYDSVYFLTAFSLFLAMVAYFSTGAYDLSARLFISPARMSPVRLLLDGWALLTVAIRRSYHLASVLSVGVCREGAWKEQLCSREVYSFVYDTDKDIEMQGINDTSMHSNGEVRRFLLLRSRLFILPAAPHGHYPAHQGWNLREDRSLSDLLPTEHGGQQLDGPSPPCSTREGSSPRADRQDLMMVCQGPDLRVRLEGPYGNPLLLHCC
eukprot:767530-Hanusia_phi.AAC.7